MKINFGFGGGSIASSSLAEAKSPNENIQADEDDGDRELMDEILWSDCPEELYLRRMLAERNRDEGTITDSIMGQSTVASIFRSKKQHQSSMGDSVEDYEGYSLTDFAPHTGSDATEETVTFELSPSFVDSFDEKDGVPPPPRSPERFPAESALQCDERDAVVEGPVNIFRPRISEFAQESGAFALYDRNIPEIVDGEELDNATKAGVSTLSGESIFRYIRPQAQVPLPRWWIDAEDITLAKPEGTKVTGSTRQEDSTNTNNSVNLLSRSSKSKDENAASERDESDLDCFERLIRRLMDDDKVFRRIVLISGLFIFLFVSLSAVAFVRTRDHVATASPAPFPYWQTGSPTRFPTAKAETGPGSDPPIIEAQEVSAPPVSIGNDVAAPTPAPSQMEDHFRMISDFISERSPTSAPAFDNQRSPQYQALRWSADDIQTSIWSEERILQRWTLAVLYYSLGGGGWAVNEGWLTDADECSWFSSSSKSICNEQGLLVRLHLEDNNLQGFLASEVGLLSPSLVELNLSKNGLAGSIPTTIGRFSSLLKLFLRENQFFGSLPKELSSMGSLTSLSLRQNNLEGAVPSELFHITSLRLVDLTRNDLTGPLNPGIGNLTALEYLGLSENRLSGTIPANISRLENLELLELDTNDLTGNIPSPMCEQRKGRLAVLTVDCEEVTCECCDSC